MKWVSVLDRKPKESGYYFWKGKGTWKGVVWFELNSEIFQFDENIPLNKVDENYLHWLDESEEDESA